MITTRWKVTAIYCASAVTVSMIVDVYSIVWGH